MHKIRLLLPSIIIAIILVSGCTSDSGAPSGQPSSGSPGATVAASITIPKTTYAVGEQIEGEYVVDATGSIETYVIYNCKRPGYISECDGRATSPIGDFSFAATACRINENVALCLPRTYDEPGTYVYEVLVYDCKDVEVLGKPCSDATIPDVRSSLKPIASAEKTIAVS